MHNYVNFKPRLDITPRVKTPIVSEVYFAWCYQVKDGWEEGENFIHPNSPAINIADLEADRTGDKFNLDYEKGYFNDHYIMLVIKYRKKDIEYTLYLTPEHAFKILDAMASCLPRDSFDSIKQPEYTWEELNLEERWEENEEDS